MVDLHGSLECHSFCAVNFLRGFSRWSLEHPPSRPFVLVLYQELLNVVHTQ